MRRVAVTLVAVALLMVGDFRVALNVRYSSDVLAGRSLGYRYPIVFLRFSALNRAIGPTPVHDRARRGGLTTMSP